MAQIKVQEKCSIDNIETKTIDTSKQRRYLIVAVLSLVIFALIVTGTVVGIYVGRHMSKVIYEESWVTYHNTRTGNNIKQRYIVDGNEVLIVKPGEVSIIYDYGKNHVIMQVDGLRHKASSDCVCFISTFDDNERISLDDLVNRLKTKDIIESGTFLTTQTKLTFSNSTFNTADLSKRSQEMCHGCVNLQAIMSRVTEIGDGTILKDKRQTQQLQFCFLFWFCQWADDPICSQVNLESHLGGGGEEILDCLRQVGDK